MTNKTAKKLEEKVVQPLIEMNGEVKSQFNEKMGEIYQTIENVKKVNMMKAADQKELDFLIEKVFYAKQNLDAVTEIISDFNNFDKEIEKIDHYLNDENFPENVDLLRLFKKIKVMLFMKNKLQNNPELDQLQR